MVEKIQLTVSKAYPNDSGRGIARLDHDSFKALELTLGDIIEIEGKKRTPAKVSRSFSGDFDQEIIRIDLFTRQNASTDIGEEVKIRKADVKNAKKIILTQTESTSIELGNEPEKAIKYQIMGRPLIKGDIIPVINRVGLVFSLIAIETEPEGILLITDKTVIRFRNKFKEKARNLRIFLCHSSEDKSKVRELYYLLKRDGFDPWLDEEKLLPGQEWQLEIQKAVKASDVVIVCLSSKAISKTGYIQKEIKYALDIADEQPEGSIFLIPLKLEECEVPERLRRWHWVNLFEDNGYERLARSVSVVEKRSIQS